MAGDTPPLVFGLWLSVFGELQATIPGCFVPVLIPGMTTVTRVAELHPFSQPNPFVKTTGVSWFWTLVFECAVPG